MKLLILDIFLLVNKELETKKWLCNIFSDNLGSGLSSRSGEFWRSYSAYTSGYQSVDHLSDIDEFEENFKVYN